MSSGTIIPLTCSSPFLNSMLGAVQDKVQDGVYAQHGPELTKLATPGMDRLPYPNANP